VGSTTAGLLSGDVVAGIDGIFGGNTLDLG